MDHTKHRANKQANVPGHSACAQIFLSTHQRQTHPVVSATRKQETTQTTAMAQRISLNNDQMGAVRHKKIVLLHLEQQQ